MPEGPLTLTRDGLNVAVRLTPRAGIERLAAIAETADGRRVLRASITLPPEDGHANEALLQLLARVWRLPRRDLAIVAGAASRHKTVRVTGEPQQLLDRVGAQIAALPGP